MSSTRSPAQLVAELWDTLFRRQTRASLGGRVGAYFAASFDALWRRAGLGHAAHAALARWPHYRLWVRSGNGGPLIPKRRFWIRRPGWSENNFQEPWNCSRFLKFDYLVPGIGCRNPGRFSGNPDFLNMISLPNPEFTNFRMMLFAEIFNLIRVLYRTL